MLIGLVVMLGGAVGFGLYLLALERWMVGVVDTSSTGGERGGVGIGVAIGGMLVALAGVVAPVLGEAVGAIRALGL